MDRTPLVKLWPYAAIGLLAVSLAAFILFDPQTASGLWSWAIGMVGAKWYRPTGLLLIGTTLLLVAEVLFLTWEKTTIFVIFVRHKTSAMVDVGSMIFTLLPIKTVAEHVFTFGAAFAVAILVDAANARFGWARWELSSEGILGLTTGIVVFYLFNTFIGYWQHRMMHWRWFWHLHKFHHAATEFNILTTYRTNPAEAFRIVPWAIPLFFVKPPSAEMFAVFTVVNQVLALLQHSELPWTFGWLGRWVITAPANHQVHHSIDEEHRDLNFSSCPLWDRMFGTWYDGPNRPSGYGIADGSYVARPVTQFLFDTGMFYRDITHSLAGVMRSALARIRGQRLPSQHSTDTAAPVPAE